MGLPTIVTVRGFIEDLPDAVASRLKDQTLVDMVSIHAPDYRASGPRGGRRGQPYRRPR